ncbi:MAG: ParB N-terminal domain-containing protein [Geminicoccaceae bacterium]
MAGERRWRAARRRELPVVVRPLSDQETLEVALIEDLQRADLSAIEEAQGFRRWSRSSATARRIWRAPSRRSHVANTLRLLAFTEADADDDPGCRRSRPAGNERSVAPGAGTAGAARGRGRAQRARDRGSRAARDRPAASEPCARRRKADQPRIPGPATSSAPGLEVGIRTGDEDGLVTIRCHDLLAVAQLDGLLRRLG